jgi:hypothetical protein
MAQLTSVPTGCAYDYPNLTCAVGNLAVGASITLTFTVTWTGTGAVYNSATVAADQIDTSANQVVTFGSAPASGDAPLPAWAYVLLGAALFALATREIRRRERPHPGWT